MLFNSFQFFFFYLSVLAVLFLLPFRYRWLFLLAASAYFYMCWNPKYIIFLIFMIVMDYSCGIGMGRLTAQPFRRLLFAVSLLSNLGLLFTFKYFNFFSHNLSAITGYSFPVLNLMLPIGISFHVFQSVAYTVDVYLRRIQPEKHAGIFALYVMFFPQLVAGPIERPQNLLHQFHEKKILTYENARTGTQLILWGLIKKVCIADLIAVPVNQVYSDPTLYQGPILLLATIYFAIQIYCDFSGYTDIARGVAKIMGYDLMVNFRQPYFSCSVKEFWQRWHISLSTWFRDYIYYPLGGNRVPQVTVFRNLFVVFIVSGLWHGAAWTFLIWGTLHGMYMIAGETTRAFRSKIVSMLHLENSKRYYFFQMFVTFNLILVGWVFFRANSLQNAWYILSHMYIPASITFSDVSYGVGLAQLQTLQAWALIAFLFIVDYFLAYKPTYIMQFWNRRPLRWATYSTGLCSLAFFGVWGQMQFIYFQF